MIGRHIAKNAICIVSALALVLAVICSPIRPASLARTSLTLDFVRQSFAVPSIQKTRMTLSSVGAPTSRVKALQSEGEEDDDALKGNRPTRVSGNVLPNRTPAGPNSTPLARTQTPRPLRC